MAYVQRDNSGTLGRNKNKEKESHPDHRGKAMIDGVEYWISAWVKENNTTGEKFFSLAFNRVGWGGATGERKQSALPSGAGNFDDDVPF